MKIIQNWIAAGSNFHVGAAIYNIIGGDENLKRLFARGKTVFAEKALRQALTEATATPSIIRRGNTRETKPEALVIEQSADPVLESIRKAWLPKYQRMNYLRHDLDKHQGNSPEMIAIRKPIAFEVLQLENECNTHWEEADEYKKTGKVAVQASNDEFIVPDDPLEKAKAIENCKRNIRRNRQQSAKHPDKPGLADRYNQYRNFYFRLTGTQYQENA